MNRIQPLNVLVIAAAIGLCSGVLAISKARAESVDWTSPTLIDARASMFFPGLNYLTFQHFEQMFATRPVATGATRWQLPQRQITPLGPYRLHGETLDLDTLLEQTRTNGLLVIHQGQIVHEQYRNGMTPASRHTVFSMSKSIIATLVGIALEEGQLHSLDDQVVDYLPEMAGSGYAAVSIEQLLRMRSGVNWEERYEFGSDTQLTEVHDNALVGYRYRWCDYAQGAELAPQADTGFNYSTLDTSVLGCILEAATGTQVATYMAEKIWQPAGMEYSGYWIMDGKEPQGDEFYGAGFNATLRDLGRFGLMMLNQGVANQQQLVSPDWVRTSTMPDGGFEPTQAGASLGYQYQWWTLPDSNAYMAIGLFNQFIYIDPDTDTVIVKLSYPESPLGDEAGHLQLFRQIVAQLAELE